MTTEIATSAGHWYDHTGTPVWTVKGAKGQDVTPDIRHARKLGLLPGVTSVSRMMSAPALTQWMVDQALMSALTLPRIEGEALDDFKKRALADSQEQSNKARDKGTELHTALEMAVQGKVWDSNWKAHIGNTYQTLQQHGVDLMAGDPERAFAHPLGFGGKNDWHSVKQGVLLDYKSKPKIEEGKKLAYDEHVMQLSACSHGLRIPGCRKLSVFIGVEDGKVSVHEWDPEDADRGWEMFKACLLLWQAKNRYQSGFDPLKVAA